MIKWFQINPCCLSQGWHDKVSVCEQFKLYREFEQTLVHEGYLSWLSPRISWDIVVQPLLQQIQIQHKCSDAYVRHVAEPSTESSKEPTFHNDTEMLLLENCVNLAKYITEAEKVKRAAQENSNFNWCRKKILTFKWPYFIPNNRKLG